MSKSIPSNFVFSQSSLQDHADCPRRFQLRYIEGLRWPAVETEPVMENERHLQEGQLFHRLVQQFLLGIPVEKISYSEHTPNLGNWMDSFLQYDFKLSDYSLYTEMILKAPVFPFWLMAKFDLLAIHPDGKVMIVDWKTNLKRPRDEWMASRMQTRVYIALLVHAGACLNYGKNFLPEQVQMMYWYAGYPDQPCIINQYTIQEYDRAWRSLQDMIAGIGHHEYFPLTTDEKKCVFCPYRSYCNRGVQAGSIEANDENDLTWDEMSFDQIAEIEY